MPVTCSACHWKGWAWHSCTAKINHMAQQGAIDAAQASSDVSRQTDAFVR